MIPQQAATDNRTPRRSSPSQTRGRQAWLLLVVAGAGIFSAYWSARKADREMRADLLQQARLVARAVSLDRVAALSATETDLTNVHYLRLKEQLARARSANPKCRFLYLLGQQPDGMIYFYVDSEPPGSEDESPPGQTFDEASEILHRVFDTKEETTEGPQIDRWGTWISALVPVTNEDTGELAMVLGMDVDARDWQVMIFARCAATVALTIGLFLTLSLLVALGRRARQLRDSEERYRTLFESSPDAVMTLAPPSWKFTSGNPAAMHMFDAKDEATFASLGLWDVSPDTQPDGRPSLEKAREMIETAMREGSHAFEWTHRRPNGDTFPATVLFTRVERGGQAFLQATIRDVTHQKQAEAALRSSEERFRIAAQSASDLIWEWDIPNHTLAWFGNVDAMLGCAPGEFPRTIEAWEGVIHPDDHDRVMRRLDQHLTTHEPYVEEYRVRRKDGTLAYWTDRGEALWDDQGIARRMIGVCTDITQRKRAEEKLLQTNRELEAATARANELASRAETASRVKSEFLANMSHEIRTPMTAILGYADNLLDSDLSDSERLDAVQTIRRNGEHLLTIINDILDLSKIEAGKLDLERIPCSPIQLVAEVTSLMQVRADGKNLPFHDEFIGPVPEAIISDPTRLKQILVNLVGNAIKFTESGGVRLITRFVDDGGEPHMQFDVLDTGLGMTREQVDRLFQPFTQADTSTTRRFGGTGLGLAISKRCAEMLGGDIAVVETQEGVGTRFRVTVPTGPANGVRMIEDPALVAHTPAPSAEPMKEGDERDLVGRRVLVAEDNPTNRALVVGMLKKIGVHATAVENGQLAVDAVLAARDHGEPFDVVLMDIQMPVMGGYEATALLRQEGYTRPIIALTAHAMEGDRRKCIQAGCDDYIPKPIDRKKLVAVIRERVGKADLLVLS